MFLGLEVNQGFVLPSLCAGGGLFSMQNGHRLIVPYTPPWNRNTAGG